MALIKYVGLSDLEEVEQPVVTKVAEEYAEKIELKLKNEIEVILHIKTKREGGKEKQYHLTLRTNSPGKTFESSYWDWDLMKVTHKVFKEVLRQIDKDLGV